MRFWTVNDFLSVIVPICNAEATLSQQVGNLLEVLPDVAGRFEIVLVDDGSTDHTVEIARELACEYPQLRFIRHAEPRGVDAAVKTGSQWAQGRVVVVHEHDSPSRPTNLTHRLRRLDSTTSTQFPARQPAAQSRADAAHKSLKSSRHVTAFLNHLRNLTLGE